jgi:hypothetical protein
MSPSDKGGSQCWAGCRRVGRPYAWHVGVCPITGRRSPTIWSTRFRRQRFARVAACAMNAAVAMVLARAWYLDRRSIVVSDQNGSSRRPMSGLSTTSSSVFLGSEASTCMRARSGAATLVPLMRNSTPL